MRVRFSSANPIIWVVSGLILIDFPPLVTGYGFRLLFMSNSFWMDAEPLVGQDHFVSLCISCIGFWDAVIWKLRSCWVLFLSFGGSARTTFSKDPSLL